MANNTDLDRNVPIPLYYQLKSRLLNDIQTGVYAIGDQIPTEYELQTQYEVSRSTIRQALNELVNDGWLLRKSSKGTFVTSPEQSKSIFHSFEPFASLVNRSGKTPRTEVLELEVVEANKFIAGKMNLQPNEKVITLFRRRFVDEEPIVTVRNYLPFSKCSFVLDYDFSTQSLYQLLMQTPMTKLKSTRTIVSTERAMAEDVNLLDVKPDCPMLIFNNISISVHDVVVDLAYSHYRGDMSNFEIVSSPT